MAFPSTLFQDLGGESPIVLLLGNSTYLQYSCALSRPRIYRGVRIHKFVHDKPNWALASLIITTPEKAPIIS